MASRLLQRIAAFWGYLSPQKPRRRRTTPPRRFITPQLEVPEWAPVTPVDTPVGKKRKQIHFGPELQKKKVKHVHVEEEDPDEEKSDEDEENEVVYTLTSNNKNLGSTFLDREDDGLSYDEEDGEYDSGDEDEHDHHTLHNPTMPYSSVEGQESDAQDEEQEDSDPEPEETNKTASLNSEDEIVFIQDDNNTDGDGDTQSNISLKAFSDNQDANATVFEPSIWDHAEGNESILTDTRTRVGSLDADFVSPHYLLSRGWPADTISLIQRLHQRGHEPLFPSHWTLDFRYLPTALFLPSQWPHPARIHSLKNNTKGDFRATHALTRLISLGPKVRDKITCNKDPEPLILAELNKYMHWANLDSENSFPSYPLIALFAADTTHSVTSLQQNLQIQLSQLYQRWRQLLTSPLSPHPTTSPTSPPTLYGILVSHTIVGVVTFVPGAQGGDSTGYLRSVGVFDFGLADYDVWNSVAVALLVVHARDRLVELGCCGGGRGGTVVKVVNGEEEEEDPDA